VPSGQALTYKSLGGSAMSVTKILLVGADRTVTHTVRDVVVSIKQCRLEEVDGIDAALAHLGQNDVGLILVRLAGPPEEPAVVRLLEEVGRSRPAIPVIVLAEHGGVQLAQRLLSVGAVDCMSRPFDTARLALLIDVLTVRARFQQRTQPAEQKRPSHDHQEVLERYVLGSSAMAELTEQVRRVAPLETTILITGETGTGKTHLARVIHELSPRRSRPFVAVPCGAIPATLLESEMFGHVRGAFTHAEQKRVGKLAQVEDGTLLLDEIDCVPLEAQSKLLRSFEERIFEPVGSNASHTLRARLIVASNRPLEEEVAAGRFRADLYYRLNVVEFSVPPLRRRPQMIRPLAEKFLGDFCDRDGRPACRFSDDALTTLETYDWPGNVRELRNVVEQSVALCPKQSIDAKDLPERVRRRVPAGGMFPEAGTQNGNGLAKARKDAERGRLLEALCRNDHNRSRAAAELGVSRVTLYKKLHKYGLA